MLKEIILYGIRVDSDPSFLECFLFCFFFLFFVNLFASLHLQNIFYCNFFQWKCLFFFQILKIKFTILCFLIRITTLNKLCGVLKPAIGYLYVYLLNILNLTLQTRLALAMYQGCAEQCETTQQ